jgi:4-phytase/acid phosphatase
MFAKSLLLAALYLTSALSVSLAKTTATLEPTLRLAIVLARHGVRSPTWNRSELNAYSVEPWPDWDVAPGDLTPHGAKLMTLFGSYYRLYFASAHLLPATGCEDVGHVHMRADVDSRNRDTARALMAGMMPGCKLDIEGAGDGKDPLFSPLEAGIGKPDRALAVSSISGRIGEDPKALVKAYEGAFDTLREVLFGCPPGTSCPAETKPTKKSVLQQQSLIEQGKGSHPADLQGPLRIGSTLSEDLQLEYANGMEGKDLGWGRLDAAKLQEVMRLHAAYADLARQTPYIARIQGSNLLSHILRSIEQAVKGSEVSGSLGNVGDRVLVIVGHDTNISNLAGMLGLSWLLDGYQPNDTPPGGALVFELWQHGDGEMTVRTYYIAQSLEQMRRALPLTLDSPPLRSRIFVPGCSSPDQNMSCPWKTFERTIESAIDPSVVKP